MKVMTKELNELIGKLQFLVSEQSENIFKKISIRKSRHFWI
jgi:hypothetical protein